MTESTVNYPKVQFVDIDETYAGQRIDNFLITKLKGVPKSVIYRIIRKGEVRVNKGRIKQTYKLSFGDQVRIPPVRVSEDKTPQVSSKMRQVQDIEKAIIFEDKTLIVLNKPSGIAVHGGSGLSFGVIEALRALRPNEKMLELVHRLDRDTSGILLVAKRRSVLVALHEQLRIKTMNKVYWALVKGQWSDKQQSVQEPLHKINTKSGERIVVVDREQGKKSCTLFDVLERFDGASLVEARPQTGRTHQIRVHTACKDHPIAFDDKYGDREFDSQIKASGINRLFLHAKEISFFHPVSETTVRFEAPLDEQLEKGLAHLRANSDS
ncbi:MAG: 23S rRNA pseudouridine(955/2504/2580) synthase RluC [Gammaproteobacteria bacterium]|nr:23S rRNA pseudouridine(955/2504/2580) synthase RluC [Gammaproteobacteria bacterium]